MFSKKKYINIIEKLLHNNFSPTINWNQNFTSGKFILRHDIDFSVEVALEMAKTEKKIGIFSTYFFMMSSSLYNIISKKNQDIIKKIRDMGHKVSLHFDPTAYNNLNSFKIERNTFKELFDVDVDIVSIHRPGSFLKKNNMLLYGIAHTYQNKYFKDMEYISDSGGKDPSDLIDKFLLSKKDRALQLLLHPIWWQDKAENPTNTLNRWIKKNNNFLISEIRNNCKTYLD